MRQQEASHDVSVVNVLCYSAEVRTQTMSSFFSVPFKMAALMQRKESQANVTAVRMKTNSSVHCSVVHGEDFSAVSGREDKQTHIHSLHCEIRNISYNFCP